MPTGAGKTGVIAVISSLQSESGPVLVLAPSEALVDQLRDEIREEFWSTIGADAPWPPDQVVPLLPSLDEQLQQLLRRRNTRSVIVGTFQALQQIRESKHSLYEFLRSRIHTILIDEGHREPAQTWAEAVRTLAKPTILFSATPYRNDQRLFNVSEEFIHYLSFNDAVRAHYIRDVQFHSVRSAPSAAAFATTVVNATRRLIRDGDIDPHSKVIIHASSEDRVTALLNAFQAVLGNSLEGCIAFHENFDASTPARRASVPDLQQLPHRYYIHQYKLIEGLDEPKFAVFAPYDDFTNTRQLVQQIGRIIRNPTPRHRPRHRAVVLVPEWSAAEALWADYRSFDRECESRDKPVLRTEDFLARYLDALPALDYVNKRFAKRLDLANPDLFDEIVVPRSCVIFRIEPGLTLNTLVDALRNYIEKDDRVVLRDRNFRDGCYTALSVRTGNSQLLQDSYFPEFSLHVTAARIRQPYLFCADTGGLWIDEIPGVIERLRTEQLRHLFPESKATRISGAVVKNSDVGRFAIRSRSMSARSLEDAAPFMGDYLHLMARARGHTSAGSRYIGFTRGRIRDEQRMSSSISDFITWTSEIADELDAAKRPARYLGRFAVPVRPPADPSPRNILLDIESLESSFKTADGSTSAIVEDLCVDVSPAGHSPSGDPKGSFALDVLGAQRAVEIVYDRARKRFKLFSPFLDTFTDTSNEKFTLLSRLNQKQAFRILCASVGYVYSSGDFYRINDEVGMGTLRKGVEHLLTPLNDLATIHTEKGQGPGNGNDWAANSLFHFIDRALQNGPLAEGFNEVVCDDLRDEAADFIAYRQAGTGKIVFVHAKAAGGAGAGASHLYDVCSQAMKNLAYLRYGARPLPSAPHKWDDDWHIQQYHVAPRIRRGTGTSHQIRERLQALLISPNTDREMWLVLGGILSKGALDAALAATPPQYFAVQTAYLLTSADAACKSVGVRLRVFCAN